MINIKSVTKSYDSAGELINYHVIYEDDSWYIVGIGEENRRYRHVQTWVADGNTIAEPA